ncbi:peptidylprolyl isomerase [Chondromyces apiculatus]|uniref:Peptidyl-prolyl cis-trans isomerase n=1 Tax=Chondromyces apiculatus DSM 436 TaxID=1192034 RepID=A0A017TD22_9BACT|nr:peptidylprolyl isomerase [Chondromyces apiculatus]EYF06511.1 Peptidyl-prolyl cis-trans isomerase PpiA precursor [Chondromyces apiculatus DSM 436]
MLVTLPRSSVRSPALLAAALTALTMLGASACSKGDAPAPGATTGSASAKSEASAAAASAASAKAQPAPTGSALTGDAPIFHPELAKEQAPDTYKVKFTTTKGDFVVQVTRAWAPNGADRFFNLVKLGFYDGVRLHRVVDGFMAQFGVSPNPSVNGAWFKAFIPDDKREKSNKRGLVTFATAGADMRTTQVFVNYADKNARLDSMGFTPFGEVVEGMSVVDSFYKGYGELAPQGKGPNPFVMQSQGDAYIEKDFPLLDRIKEAKIL